MVIRLLSSLFGSFASMDIGDSIALDVSVPWPETLVDRVMRLRISVAEIFHRAAFDVTAQESDSTPVAAKKEAPQRDKRRSTAFSRVESSLVKAMRAASASSRPTQPMHISSPNATFDEDTPVSSPRVGTKIAVNADATCHTLRVVEAQVVKLIQHLADNMPEILGSLDDKRKSSNTQPVALRSRLQSQQLDAPDSSLGTLTPQSKSLRNIAARSMRGISPASPTMPAPTFLEPVDPLAEESARQKLKALQIRLHDSNAMITNQRAHIDTLKIFCVRKDKALDYIRETLFHEVCVLKEQLHRQNQDPTYVSDFGTIFDCWKVLEGDDPSGGKDEAVRMAKEGIQEELSKMISTNSAIVRKKDDEIAMLKKNVNDLQSSKSGPSMSRKLSMKRGSAAGVGEAQEQFEFLTTEMAKKDVLIAELQEIVSRLRDSADNATIGVKGYKDQLTKIHDDVEATIDVKDREIVSKSLLIRELETKLRYSEQRRAAAEQTKHEFEELQLKVASSTSEIEDLRAQIVLLTDQRDEAINEQNNIAKHLEEISSSTADTKVLIERNAKHQFSRLESDVKAMQLQLADEKSNVEELKGTLQDLQCEMGLVREENAQLRALPQNNPAQLEVKVTQPTISSRLPSPKPVELADPSVFLHLGAMKQENEMLRIQLQDAENAVAEVDELRGKINELHHVEWALKNHIVSLERELDINRALGADRTANALLANPVATYAFVAKKSSTRDMHLPAIDSDALHYGDDNIATDIAATIPTSVPEEDLEYPVSKNKKSKNVVKLSKGHLEATQHTGSKSPRKKAGEVEHAKHVKEVETKVHDKTQSKATVVSKRKAEPQTKEHQPLQSVAHQPIPSPMQRESLEEKNSVPLSHNTSNMPSSQPTPRSLGSEEAQSPIPPSNVSEVSPSSLAAPPALQLYVHEEADDEERPELEGDHVDVSETISTLILERKALVQKVAELEAALVAQSRQPAAFQQGQPMAQSSPVIDTPIVRSSSPASAAAPLQSSNLPLKTPPSPISMQEKAQSPVEALAVQEPTVPAMIPKTSDLSENAIATSVVAPPVAFFALPNAAIAEAVLQEVKPGTPRDTHDPFLNSTGAFSEGIALAEASLTDPQAQLLPSKLSSINQMLPSAAVCPQPKLQIPQRVESPLVEQPKAELQLLAAARNMPAVTNAVAKPILLPMVAHSGVQTDDMITAPGGAIERSPPALPHIATVISASTSPVPLGINIAVGSSKVSLIAPLSETVFVQTKLTLEHLEALLARGNSSGIQRPLHPVESGIAGEFPDVADSDIDATDAGITSQPSAIHRKVFSSHRRFVHNAGSSVSIDRGKKEPTFFVRGGVNDESVLDVVESPVMSRGGSALQPKTSIRKAPSSASIRKDDTSTAKEKEEDFGVVPPPEAPRPQTAMSGSLVPRAVQAKLSLSACHEVKRSNLHHPPRPASSTTPAVVQRLKSSIANADTSAMVVLPIGFSDSSKAKQAAASPKRSETTNYSALDMTPEITLSRPPDISPLIAEHWKVRYPPSKQTHSNRQQQSSVDESSILQSSPTAVVTVQRPATPTVDIAEPHVVDSRQHITHVFLGAGISGAIRGVKEKVKSTVKVESFMKCFGEAYIDRLVPSANAAVPFVELRDNASKSRPPTSK